MRAVTAPHRPTRFLPPLLWMAVIAAGSSSLLESDRTGAWTRAVLAPLLPGVGPDTLALLHGILRKLGHLVEYGTLAVLWRRALAPSPGAMAWAWVLATGYGGVDELRQGLTPARVPAAPDVVLDAAGALLSLAAWEGSGRPARLVGRGAIAATALVTALGAAFLALDRMLARQAWDVAASTLVLALAAGGAARAHRAWHGRS